MGRSISAGRGGESAQLDPTTPKVDDMMRYSSNPIPFQLLLALTLFGGGAAHAHKGAGAPAGAPPPATTGAAQAEAPAAQAEAPAAQAELEVPTVAAAPAEVPPGLDPPISAEEHAAFLGRLARARSHQEQKGLKRRWGSAPSAMQLEALVGGYLTATAPGAGGAEAGSGGEPAGLVVVPPAEGMLEDASEAEVTPLPTPISKAQVGRARWKAMDEAQRQAMFDELAQHLRNGDVDYEDFLLERLQRGLPYVDRRHWEAQVRGQEEKGAPAVAPAPKAKRSWWCCGS